MKGMRLYYASRTLVAIAVGLIILSTGANPLTALLGSGLTLGWFMLAPHSGRYSIHPEFGITALRRDERTQSINDKAARNGFVVSMIVLAGINIYFGSAGQASIPSSFSQSILAVGALTYLISDIWLRRFQQD